MGGGGWGVGESGQCLVMRRGRGRSKQLILIRNNNTGRTFFDFNIPGKIVVNSGSEEIANEVDSTAAD